MGTTDTAIRRRMGATLNGANLPQTTSLVLMHFLGGSTYEWDEVRTNIGEAIPSVAFNLPGFGGSADETGFTVAEMADFIQAKLTALRLSRYVLVGHSMSGKIALVLARRFQDLGKNGPAGLVLVAPSPPSPEPMTDEKRDGMIARLGEVHDDDLERATAYISSNGQRDIPPAVLKRTAQEVLRMDRAAWLAWLTQGSREDWAERVGLLDLPVLVVAGEKDASMGPETQKRVTLPHLRHAEMKVLPSCSHQIPLERPVELAAMLVEFVRGLEPGRALVPKEYLAFIESERLSSRTREVVEERLAGPQAAGDVLDARQERTLRAMVETIVPQEHQPAIDLTGYVLARLASGKGDGWRYAVLPEDVKAYREQLDVLADKRFADEDEAARQQVLEELAAAKGSAGARWFEDLRADAVSAYMAHPATLARVGYSGLGVGGAATEHKGFVTLGSNEREDWEPLPEEILR